MGLVPFTAHFGAGFHDYDLTRVSATTSPPPICASS